MQLSNTNATPMNFRSSLILLQNFVPISLYITVEVVKTIQAYFIYSDLRMYYESLDMPCKPKSWNLSDNLGRSGRNFCASLIDETNAFYFILQVKLSTSFRTKRAH